MPDEQKRERAAWYNRHKRNPEADKFYHSAAWRGPNGARTLYIAEHPTCERCQLKIAAHVHHKIPFDECTEVQKTDPANLMAVCIGCHNAIEARAPKLQPVTAIGTLTVTEDDEFYFDEEAADRACRFIEKFCRHYEGRFAGQPFKLLEWQRWIVRTLFGWKNRSTNLRRFRELYLITAKGAGKTPLLAAIGLYMLLGDGEAGAHVVSMASSFEQANLTFDSGKKYIAESPELSRHPSIQVKQYAIAAPRYSKWTTISGKPTGRSGPRPSCIIADEAHEWPAATGTAFDLLCANLFKRSQPLLLVATNAGADRNCYAWQLHERAVAVLNGTSTDKTLLPVIYESPRELEWQSEDAARAANPSLGEIVSFEQLKPEQTKGEARYRRLYLSQWVTGEQKWIDTSGAWRECQKPLDVEAIKDAPRYLGFDGSNGDDLVAAVDVYVTDALFHVASRFWLPRATGERYEKSDLHPYTEWGEQGAITLLESKTISIAVQQQIAAEIIESHKSHPVTAVCYDRAYSGGVVELLRAAGIECREVRQGYTVGQGCEELDRRLIERSIAIDPSPVMDFCARNVEVAYNRHGQYWPAKPAAHGRYAGKRASKIDGVSAMVNALTEARLHAFPQPQPYVGVVMVEL